MTPPFQAKKMTDMTTIAAPLAAALSAKGYESLTPVQNAMLTPDVAGRDLLVSAQTGSGKTVAFGIAIAPELLAGADRLLFADVPGALIIAPTRELAQQVARELEWLYADAGAQIATCVGGMDYRTEKRALERGAHIVVGTPGRLRDHIERRSLDLSGARAVVLDEADEMLDLGFAEDLEFILQAAPENRRTLMFSATVPKAIAELAKTFQTDALRIQTQGEAKQHVDIEYRALNVQARDREHAIFNTLRYYEARTAIVFCKTRMNVNHLLARMGNRGFQAVALSGELSQTERMHALQALRDGRARVCIATDVAARGIDLPGLELVIHADLPTNSETLLHRSGRTGRAGQKGVSALIVAPADFKKAQRLLQGAKVVAEWAKAPSAEEVQAKDDARLLDHPSLTAAPGDEQPIASDLLERYGPDRVAAAFVRMWRDGRSAPEVLADAVSITPSAPRERGEFGESTWFSLSVGRSGRAEARWLLPKICDAGGITKDAIGAIRVQEDQTFVQIARAVSGKFGDGLELESGVAMTRLEGEPSLDRPERAPRASSPRALSPRASSPRSSGPRPERAPRPSTAREDGAPRPVRADKPAYQPKPARIVEEEAAAAPRKPYVKREDAERKPYAPRGEGAKPYTPRTEGAKPYAPRAEGAKPYAKREDSDRKPYAPREDGPRKPRWSPEDRDAKPAPRSAGSKSHGGDKARAVGYKSHRDGDAAPGYKPARVEGAEGRPMRPGKPGGKPFGKPAGDRPAKAAGFKSHGPAKAGGFKAGAKPARPAADAKDTSKRFVPPKKPRG
jgi:ATP-dependent RNA helicase DeaD